MFLNRNVLKASIYLVKVPITLHEYNDIMIAVPSKPLDLKALGITSTTIELSWSKPKSANGAIKGYRIYYMHSNYTDVNTYKLSEEDPKTIDFNLLKLCKLSFFY